MDWRGACIVPLYKWKGDKCECSNSSGFSLLSVVGKLYGRVLIKRVRAGTECAIGEEQCGFRQGRKEKKKCLFKLITFDITMSTYLS